MYKYITYISTIFWFLFLANLLSYTNTGTEPSSHIKDIGDVHVIYLHALQSGLLRVKMQGPIGRYNCNYCLYLTCIL